MGLNSRRHLDSNLQPYWKHLRPCPPLGDTQLACRVLNTMTGSECPTADGVLLAAPAPRKDVCSTVDGDELVGAVNCPYRLRAGGIIYPGANGHMAKTDSLRPRFGLIGGQKEFQQPLDVSVIGPGMRVVGHVHSPSVVTVAGTVLGTVSADDQVNVTKGGRVEGDVEAREVVLGGEVHGLVDARERLEIQASAVVRGDLHAPRLMMQEGAVVNGDVSIAESSTE